ncbi:MAG TPA: hypothetical protein VLX09_14220 [Stellaceae bacterium]|nr:hypothetical protein [Stellaceae bacterium]
MYEYFMGTGMPNGLQDCPSNQGETHGKVTFRARGFAVFGRSELGGPKFERYPDGSNNGWRQPHRHLNVDVQSSADDLVRLPRLRAGPGVHADLSAILVFGSGLVSVVSRLRGVTMKIWRRVLERLDADILPNDWDCRGAAWLWPIRASEITEA